MTTTPDLERLIAAIDGLHERAWARQSKADMRAVDELDAALGWEPDGFFVRPGSDWLRDALRRHLTATTPLPTLPTLPATTTEVTAP